MHAHAKERQSRRIVVSICNTQRDLYDDGAEAVRQNVPQNDGTVCRADRSRRLDILYISYGQNRTSDDTRKNRDRRRRQRNGQILRTRTSAATITIAKSVMGIASRISVIRMIRLSILPPK